MKRRPRRGFGEDGFESAGGYMAAKKEKLKVQFAHTAAKEVGDGPEQTASGIFNGIAIYVNGFTTPSADELKRIMMIHGGMYHHYLGQNTTHIVATNLPNVKIVKLKVMKVVKPEWIVDSVQANKLLDFRTYLLYSHQSVTQPRLQLGNSSKTSTDDNWHLASTSIPQDTSKPSDKLTDDHKTLPDIRLGIPIAPDDVKTNVKEFSESSCESNVSNALSPRPTTCLEGTANCGSEPSVADAHSERQAPKTSSWTSRSAGEAGFLSEFYNNSRLHHLSTMGATFKQYVNELREKNDNVFSGREELKKWKLGNQSYVENDDRDENDGGNVDEVDIKDDKMEKVVMHIDMDCFFVSVGLRSRPELRGLPVAVTHSKAGRPGPSRPAGGMSRQAEFDMYKQRRNDRDQKKSGSASADVGPTRVDDVDETMSLSEIASCSYEARAAGVKNGMFMGPALKLCPGLRTIPYDFQAYKQVSYALYDTVARYTLDIEAVSCDELFVDCTKLLKESGAGPLEFASFIRREIKWVIGCVRQGKTGCPASAGFGANMLQARLATRNAKPDGQFLLEPGRLQDFMAGVLVQHLPGIGRSLSWRLRGLGAESCADLQRMSLARLQQEFGAKTGQTLFQHCRGRDERALCVQHVRKSVSAEVNYGIRFVRQIEADEFVRQLAAEVSGRLKEICVKGRCITLKLMVRAKDAPVETAKFMGHGVCDHITKSATLLQAVADVDAIAREVLAITRHLAIQPSELRGVGIQVSRLESDSKATSGGILNFLAKNNCRQPLEKESVSSVHQLQAEGLPAVPPGIDPDTLAELPEDIRREVLQEYRARKLESECVAGPSRQRDHGVRPGNQTRDDAVRIPTEDAWDVNYSQIDSSFLEALPRDLQQELKTKLSRQKQDEPNCAKRQSRKKRIVKEEPKGPYDDLTLQEMRSLIKEWVRSEHEPQPCDVQMLTEHFLRLARTHNLDKLDLLIKCLHRCVVAKKSDVWEQTYHAIVEETQETMIRIFGHRLLICSQFPIARLKSPSKAVTSLQGT